MLPEKAHPGPAHRSWCGDEEQSLGARLGWRPGGRSSIIATPDPPLENTTGAESPTLARKPNYGFEKRKKELDRKAKKDAKRDERRRRDEAGTEDPGATPPPDEGAAPGDLAPDERPA